MSYKNELYQMMLNTLQCIMSFNPHAGSSEVGSMMILLYSLKNWKLIASLLLYSISSKLAHPHWICLHKGMICSVSVLEKNWVSSHNFKIGSFQMKTLIFSPSTPPTVLLGKITGS